MTAVAGIYKIVHVETERVYVGSSSNIERRFAAHKKLLRNGRHHSPKLQGAWTKYGADSFEFSVIESVDDLKDLLVREQYWIDTLGAMSREVGFNVCPVAGTTLGLKIGPMKDGHRVKIAAALRGVPLSEDRKERISSAKKGKMPSPENIARSIAVLRAHTELHGSPTKGRPLSDEHKRKVAATLTGHKRSAETIERMRLAAIKRHEIHGSPTLGRKHSEETLAKMRAAWELRRQKQVAN